MTPAHHNRGPDRVQGQPGSRWAWSSRVAWVVLAWGLAGCGTTPAPRSTPLRSGAVPGGGGQAGRPAPVRVPAVSPRTGPRAVPATSAWVQAADRWVGTPYRLGGGDRRGVDCSGFAAQLHRELTGARLPRTTGDQFRAGRPVSRRELQPGDLVFFDTGGRGVSHVGVMVGGDRFAHASTSRGVMYSRLAEDYWNRRYLGARRP
jgi:lipoprotein Spr